MSSSHARLDRLIGGHLGISRKAVKPLLAAGRVRVGGNPVRDAQRRIGPFDRVTLDDRALCGRTPVYLMMNKPGGVVSATRDRNHATVVDLLRRQPGMPDATDLHIAGRLDARSTGLLLLTNDGDWSRRLADPACKVGKRYRVTLAKPLAEEHVRAFAEGMYFAYEGITTRPARLRIIAECEAEVILTEGRYHQIRRMFGRFRNPVLALHRVAVGSLSLDGGLPPGHCRALTAAEIDGICSPPARPA